MKNSLFGVYHPTHKLVLFVFDLLSIAFSFSIASYHRLGVLPDFSSVDYFGLNFIILSSIFLGNGYTSGTLGSPPRLPLNTFFIIAASSIPCSLYIYFLGPERFTALFGRGVFPVAILTLGIVSVISRYSINLIFRDISSKKRALILGPINSHSDFKGTIETMHLNVETVHALSLGFNNDRPKFDLVVITPDHKLSDEEQQQLITYRLKGTPIFSLPDFFESFSFLVPVQEINNDWFIRTQGFSMLHSSVVLRVKRLVDVTLALILLVFTLPIFLLAAIAIKLTSKGPIFFKQIRVGLRGNEFVLFKFRTMKLDAEICEEQWAKENDPRVIPVGGFLRRSRIDELPQCWNILRGEMSFIGPRPERPNFTRELSKKIPYYDLRHIVKPGLTGWAQVCYPYGASINDSLKKLQYDLYYIKNYSLLLDLNIILRTPKIMLGLKGR